MKKRILHVRGVRAEDSRMNQKYSRVDLSGCDVVSTLHDAERFLETGEYTGVYIEGLAIAPRSGYSIESGLKVARKVKEMGLPLVVMDVSLMGHTKELEEIGTERVLAEVGCITDLQKALREVLGFE